mmetsp:Transcript_45775/g.83879  ORF Transcript_45775/g.83879 Transcript_45775/m.83879 type:complete len:653 (+) Transcript_45775:90-2048(+)
MVSQTVVTQPAPAAYPTSYATSARRPGEDLSDHRYDPLDHHYIAPSHTAAQELQGTAASQALGPTHEIRNTLGALCVAIQDVLQAKHGLPLDDEDLVRKVRANCRPPSSTAGVLEPIDVVAQLNSQKGVRYCTKNRSRLVSLWFDAHPVDSFNELQQEVDAWPGVSRAVALLRPSSSRAPGRSTAWQAVAVTQRDSASPSNLLAGRAVSVIGSLPPGGLSAMSTHDDTALVSFDEADLWSAELVDVKVLKMEGLDDSRGLITLPVPPIRQEYMNHGLGPQLDPGQVAIDEYYAQAGRLAGTSSCRAQSTPPRRQRRQDAERPISPSYYGGASGVGDSAWMQRIELALAGAPMASTIEQTSAAVQELSARLSNPNQQEVQRTRVAIDRSNIHSRLVACVQKAGSVTPTATSRWREGQLGVHAARCIGLDALGNPLGRDLFLQERAMPALQSFLQCWNQDEDAARTAVFAIRQLVTSDAAAVDALSRGVPQTVRDTMRRYPQMLDMRENGGQTLDILARHHQAWGDQYRRFCQGIPPGGMPATARAGPAPPALVLPGAPPPAHMCATGLQQAFLPFPALAPPRGLQIPRTASPMPRMPPAYLGGPGGAPPLMLPLPPSPRPSRSPPGTPQPLSPSPSTADFVLADTSPFLSPCR